jgi:kynurenine formamidase
MLPHQINITKILNSEIENPNSEIKTMAFPLANGPGFTLQILAPASARRPVRAVGFPLQSLTRPGHESDEKAHKVICNELAS